MSGGRARSQRHGARPVLRGKETFETREDYDLGAPKSLFRRETPLTNEDGMDDTDTIEAVFGNPDLYVLAAEVPERPKTKPGCPADYPAWALVGYGVLISQKSSARAVHFTFQNERNWQHILEVMARTAGQHEVDALRPKARVRSPNRDHWIYWSRVNRHLAEHLEEVYGPRAVAQAQAQGLLDPGTPANWGARTPATPSTATERS